ncbi:MAG: hypothetical protein KFKLKKLM_00122 [Flavobacteriales bacterium]|nr:hypothetical protein [Flavobacteriales bacterium]
MPTVLIVNGFRFYFYSNENDEPIHIHIEKAEGNAKFWLEPTLKEEYSYDFTANQKKEIKRILENNQEQLKKAWNEYFG